MRRIVIDVTCSICYRKFVRYDWYAEAIRIGYGHRLNWSYARHYLPFDIYQDNQHDLLGLYCMGGEL